MSSNNSIDPYITTPSQIIKNHKKSAFFWQKFWWATAYFISKKREKNPNYTWRNLPSKIKYGFVFIKHLSDLPFLKLVNPAMQNFGGMIGGSKFLNHQKFPKKFRPATLHFTSGTSAKDVLAKVNQICDFPVMYKPDFGEQSSFVTFLKDESSLKKFFKTELPNRNFLIEAYIPHSNEYGIGIEYNFETKQFEINSFTHKKKPTITGNGKSSVRNLIQSLELSSNIKNNIFNKNSSEFLESIIPLNKTIDIVYTATAYNGIINENMIQHKNKNIEQHLNECLKNFDGFYFGRFDIKANGIEGLNAGEFMIIELNGTGGVPLNSYCLENTLDETQKNIINYYETMISIGKRNQKTWKQKKPSHFEMWKNFIHETTKQRIPGKTKNFWIVGLEILWLSVTLQWKKPNN